VGRPLNTAGVPLNLAGLTLNGPAPDAGGRTTERPYTSVTAYAPGDTIPRPFTTITSNP
jgi:hypothetical protein